MRLTKEDHLKLRADSQPKTLRALAAPQGSEASEPEIIENGICDACGKQAQYLQSVNCAPVVNACICRACLKIDPPPNSALSQGGLSGNANKQEPEPPLAPANG